MLETFDQIRQAIIDDPANKLFLDKGWLPVYTASEKSKIIIIGQAPGWKAQESNTPWNDASGDKLRLWLNMDRETFYSPDEVALIPMDFYYPGKGIHGDNPPRKEFAPLWHPRLFAAMPNVELIILAGSYSQKYYLKPKNGTTLTKMVSDYAEYLPTYFPLVHPSPLTLRWRALNPWFETDVVPVLRERVERILGK